MSQPAPAQNSRPSPGSGLTRLRAGPDPSGQGRCGQAGLTLLELLIASGLIAVLLLASAAALGESLDATTRSKDLTRAALFLESVEEDLTAMPAGDLLAMNGQRVFSIDDAANARFRIEIEIFMVSPLLLQIQLTLVDQQSDRTVATLHSMRARA